MEVSGEFPFRAPPAVLWGAFTSREFLQKVIPGCKELKEVEPDRFQVNIEIGLAGIKGKYSGSVHITEKDVPKSYRMRVEGKGLPGWVKAEGRLELQSADPASTKVVYAGQFQAGGLIAGIGQRMLEGVAKLMIKQFFQAVEKEIQKDA